MSGKMCRRFRKEKAKRINKEITFIHDDIMNKPYSEEERNKLMSWFDEFKKGDKNARARV